MSNRLTFSLASLVFLIAFGLVFGTTSVMAHPAAGVAPTQVPDDPTTHTHDGMNPVAAIADDPTTDDVTENTPAHNSHPTVNITVKKGDNVSADGTKIKITDADNDPSSSTGQTFTLVIDFNQVILGDAQDGTNASPKPTTGQLAAADLTGDIENVASTPAVVVQSGDLSIGAPTVVGTDYSKYEALVTIDEAAGIPSGTKDADDEELTFRVVLDVNAVFSLQTLGSSPGPGQAPPVYQSGGNAASKVFEFTLVKAFPDTTPVKVTITPPTELNDDGKAVFNISFDGALGTGGNAFVFADLTVTGGTATASDLKEHEDSTTAMPKWTLDVTPESGAIVTVALNADSVYGDDDLPVDHTTKGASASFNTDTVRPMVESHKITPVTVTAADATAKKPAGYYLEFEFTFDEKIKASSFTVDAIDRSASDNVTYNLNVFGPVPATDSDVLTITVIPQDPAAKSSIHLKVGDGSVEDLAGNGLAASYAATYSPPVANTPPFFRSGAGVENLPEGLCVDDSLPYVVDKDGNLLDVILPLANDTEDERNLTYSLKKGTVSVPNAMPASGSGFYWETTDAQTRILKGTATLDDGGSYNWTVTDSHGASATFSFPIIVKDHQIPKEVSGLLASKVESDSLVSPTKNRVRLTWNKPADKRDYPDCIPLVTDYVVTYKKYDRETEAFGTAMTQEFETTDTSADGVDKLTYDLQALPTGIYQFTITAKNVKGSGPASKEAVWEKTGGKRVVVADPPNSPEDLDATIDSGSVTLDWLKVPDLVAGGLGDGGAPIYDDLVTDTSHADYAKLKKVRDDFYGSDVTGDFGGYAIYQTNERTAQVTRYPASGTLTTIGGGSDTAFSYTHPAFQVKDLPSGEYVFRVVAKNVAGESADSHTATKRVVIVGTGPTPTNKAPDFGEATIASITVTEDQAISGRILPEATDADSGDTLTYWIEDSKGVVTTTPSGLTFTSATRALTGTPSEAKAESLYTYKVSDRAVTINVADGKATTSGKTDSISFFITVTSAGPGPTQPPTAATSLAAGGHVVYVRSLANAPDFGTSNPAVAEWAEMPNLYELFAMGGGGSLQLNVTNVEARKVVISEVMWAVDEGKVGQDSYDGQQWIEVHNTMTTPVAISSISFATQSGRPALAQGTDLISNVVGAGSQWFGTKGQNGNSTAGSLKAFVSMYRNNLGKEGWNGAHWTTSTNVYHPNHKGTPGVGEPKGPVVIGTTTVPRSPIIFNEISNNTNPDHEWIELRNVSGGNVNLKNYEVTMVTAVDSDVDLIDFTGADRNVPAGEVLLVVKKDPTGDPNHPLAAGWNFGARNTWTVAKPGEANYVPGVNENSPRYMVASTFNALPDTGEFVLILRNRQDRNGSTGDDNIRDIAGYVPGTRLKVETADKFTNLWPLSNFHNANAEQNKFASGTVHRRQHAGTNGTDRSRRDRGNNADDGAFRDEGWTGIGYKRNATPNAQNGGTPGYKHGVLHSNDDSANKAVIISEIMPTTGDRNLPEWIELRNLSHTIGVNVDNWRLTITNHDSDGAEGTYDGDLSHTINISGRIPPGQTYLIVARSGRNTTNLPSERVHNAGRTRNQLLLNPYGFEIKLESKKDNNYLLVDTVGNLGEASGRRSRSFADTAWDMPATTDESGDRISIVRVPMKNGGWITGTLEGAWKSFEDSEQSNQTDDMTHYGHQSDFGSPGHTAGGVLPVSLSKFRPERLATGEVAVRWVTESETNNAGFNILRGEALDGVFTKLNTQLIKGQGTTSERTAYEFVDKTAKPNVVYYYQIQDVSLDGEVVTLKTTHMRGNISVVGKLTTTWGELKALQ